MSKKGGSPPPPPDPNKTGQAQTATNVSTAIANAWLKNPSQVTPFGDLTFAETGQYTWFDPLDKSPGRSAAEQAFAEWEAQNKPPRLPDPSLKASDSQAYQQGMQAYQDWMDTRNQKIRELATENKVNLYSVPMLQAYQALSPGQQQVWNNTEASYQNLSGLAADQSSWLRNYLQNHQVDTSGVPGRQWFDGQSPDFQGAPAAPEYAHLFAGDQAPDWESHRQHIEQSIMGRLNPVLQRDEERLRSKLVAQGLQPGTEAWRQAMDDFSRKENDARLAAILKAGQETRADAQTQIAQTQAENMVRNQAFGDALKGTAFENQTGQLSFADQIKAMQAQEAQRSAALQETFTQRQEPIQEITSLIHGAPLQQPRFVSPQIDSVPTTDYAGITAENYRERLDAWKAEQAASANMWGSVLGFAGSLFGALSDPREKKAIQPTGKKLGGVPVVAFRYKSEPKDAPKRLGVLASAVEKKAPGAVIQLPVKRPGARKNLRAVNYAALMQRKGRR